MKNTYLILTSIAEDKHPILNKLALDSARHEIPFIMIGDSKSPKNFELQGCDFYSLERQKELNFSSAKSLPEKHYSRKNLGYLIAISKGAEVIIETDDDNWPKEGFWQQRNKNADAILIEDDAWINVYKYFTDLNVWPRGFALEFLQNKIHPKTEISKVISPIQQGLADNNPDVDAIYRLALPLPIKFNESENIALGNGAVCPFNSQNTTWFSEAFPLLYLPSFCSFRMTDIWRSFIAQRIAWENNWPILFHNSTVIQERNDHNLLKDFQDEIDGYLNNQKIVNLLKELNLKSGVDNIGENLYECYSKLVEDAIIPEKELRLVENWLEDLQMVNENSDRDIALNTNI